MLLNKLKWLIILAGFCAACEGPEPAPVDICAMNPIAASCGHGPAEVIESALTGSYTVGPVQGKWGTPFRCPGQTIFATAHQFAGVPDTLAFTPAQTRFDLFASSFNSVGNVTMASGQFVLVEAMDGPYHVLYNDSTFLAYVQDAAHPSGTSLPVAVPAFGIWIYAAHERTDYPQGAEVITFDSVPGGVSPLDGICGGRQQFVEAL